jgi:hypothetical protein
LIPKAALHGVHECISAIVDAGFAVARTAFQCDRGSLVVRSRVKPDFGTLKRAFIGLRRHYGCVTGEVRGKRVGRTHPAAHRP